MIYTTQQEKDKRNATILSSTIILGYLLDIPITELTFLGYTLENVNTEKLILVTIAVLLYFMIKMISIMVSFIKYLYEVEIIEERDEGKFQNLLRKIAIFGIKLDLVLNIFVPMALITIAIKVIQR